MKIKQQHIIVGLLVLLQSALVAVSAPQSIGSVVAMKGRSFARTVNGKQRKLKPQAPIYLHDTIITAADSQIQLVLKDETSISQGANSEITIDEYLYTPGKAEENSTSIKMTKGIFRVITGQITKLNPDRFRVRTSAATIGIRGCDVLIRVTPQGHDVFVLDLHGFDSVIIRAGSDSPDSSALQDLANDQGGDAQSTGQRLIEVLERNNVVSVTSNGEMQQRTITSTELIAILNAVMQDAANTPDSGNPDQEDGDTEDGDNSQDGNNNSNDPNAPTGPSQNTFVIPDRPPIPSPYGGQQI